MKHITLAVIAVTLLLGTLTGQGATAAPRPSIADTGFADFQSNAWWTPYAMAGAYYQLIEGEPDPAAPSVPYAHTLFAPDRTVTRTELAVLVARAADLTQGAGARAFADVPTGAWFTPSVCALVSSGVIEPGDYPGREFQPNVPATRRQLAAWAGRLLALDGAPLSDLGQIQGLPTLPVTRSAPSMRRTGGC